MNTLTYILIYSLLGGVVSLVGGLVLLSNRKMADRLAAYATPFAGGALLAAVFLDLLKEGIEVSRASTVLLATLIGVVCFFFAEGFLHWFHHHHSHSDKRDPKTWLIIIGDTLHNALDGVAIAASFMISVPTGIVTTLAVAAHEIPQEIGDFGLLLSKGMKRRQVLLVNIISALATTLAALITYLIGSEDKLPLGVLLGLSAGFLLYVAMSDIIPALHSERAKKGVFAKKALLFLAGVVVVGVSINYAHKYIDAGHEHEEPICHHLSKHYNKSGDHLLHEDSDRNCKDVQEAHTDEELDLR